MFAIIDLNGKQYRVEEGRYVEVDHVLQNPDEVIEVGNVLMVVDGETTLLGAPYVEGATVKAKVLTHTRGPKVLVYKMRCKKGYRRKNGHRQDFTRLQIEAIDFSGRTSAKAAAKKSTKQAEPPAEEVAS